MILADYLYLAKLKFTCRFYMYSCYNYAKLFPILYFIIKADEEYFR